MGLTDHLRDLLTFFFFAIYITFQLQGIELDGFRLCGAIWVGYVKLVHLVYSALNVKITTYTFHKLHSIILVNRLLNIGVGSITVERKSVVRLLHGHQLAYSKFITNTLIIRVFVMNFEYELIF